MNGLALCNDIVKTCILKKMSTLSFEKFSNNKDTAAKVSTSI